MTRVIHWITEIIRDSDAAPEPHFHQGPESTPAVCYDTRCDSPQLDVSIA